VTNERAWEPKGVEDNQPIRKTDTLSGTYMHTLATDTDDEPVYFVEISMPPVTRKRRCPKGHEVTVIGLPAKKIKEKPNTN